MRTLCTLLLSLSLLLSGCSNVDLSDVSTGAGATGAAVVASVVTANPAIIAGATLTGATAGAMIVDDQPLVAADYGGADGEINSFYELLTFAVANFFQHVVALGIGLSLVWILTGYFGMRKRRPEEKQLERQSMMLIEKIAKMKETD